ncbi:MAG: hypothetical protein H7A46_21380 [Verrucomicrobiales bacterium]|nr:hypothetical protein [Verrucomicrobiales bacterium]
MSEPVAQDQLMTDFDWQTLYDRLGEDARKASNDPRMVEFVVRLLEILLPGSCTRLNARQVGLRVIALAWVLSPAYFDGTPSIRELAARCGVPRSVMTALTGEMSRLIGWRNGAQQHAWNWQRLVRSPHR